MADVLDAGKALIAQFIAKLPEEQRGSATELFGKPEAQEAIKLAGESALMRADYSRHMDAVAQEKARVKAEADAAAAYKAQLDSWYTGAKDVLALGSKAKEAGWSPEDPGDGNPSPRAPFQTPAKPELPADVVRTAELENQAQLAVRYMNTAIPLGIRHFREFGEELDLNALITDPRVAQLGIMGVYDAKYKDRYDEKAKATQQTEWAKREEAIRADERKKFANRPVHPVVGGESSPLDALDPSAQKPGTASVDDMAAEYERLVAAKSVAV